VNLRSWLRVISAPNSRIRVWHGCCCGRYFRRAEPSGRVVRPPRVPPRICPRGAERLSGGANALDSCRGFQSAPDLELSDVRRCVRGDAPLCPTSAPRASSSQPGTARKPLSAPGSLGRRGKFNSSRAPTRSLRAVIKAVGSVAIEFDAAPRGGSACRSWSPLNQPCQAVFRRRSARIMVSAAHSIKGDRRLRQGGAGTERAGPKAQRRHLGSPTSRSGSPRCWPSFGQELSQFTPVRCRSERSREGKVASHGHVRTSRNARVPYTKAGAP
jgi:hypothetical protein